MSARINFSDYLGVPEGAPKNNLLVKNTPTGVLARRREVTDVVIDYLLTVNDRSDSFLNVAVDELYFLVHDGLMNEIEVERFARKVTADLIDDICPNATFGPEQRRIHKKKNRLLSALKKTI